MEGDCFFIRYQPSWGFMSAFCTCVCCSIYVADQSPSSLSRSTEFKAVMNLTQHCHSLCLLHWPGVSHPLRAGQKCSSSGPTPSLLLSLNLHFGQRSQVILLSRVWEALHCEVMKLLLGAGFQRSRRVRTSESIRPPSVVRADRHGAFAGVCHTTGMLDVQPDDAYVQKDTRSVSTPAWFKPRHPVVWVATSACRYLR